MLVKAEDVCDVINNHWPKGALISGAKWTRHMTYRTDSDQWEPIIPGALVPLDDFDGDLLLDSWSDETPLCVSTFRELFFQVKGSVNHGLLDIGLEAGSLNNGWDGTGPEVVRADSLRSDYMHVSFSVKAKHVDLLKRLVEVMNEGI